MIKVLLYFRRVPEAGGTVLRCRSGAEKQLFCGDGCRDAAHLKRGGICRLQSAAWGDCANAVWWTAAGMRRI